MGAPGGCACKSSCNNLRNTFASSMGVGNRSVRVNVRVRVLANVRVNDG